MKEQEFNSLIASIEDHSFIGNELILHGRGREEGMISPNAIDNFKAIKLADALKKNPSINKVDLSHNRIGDIGTSALANVSTIEELDIGWNEISVIGATAIFNGNFKTVSLDDNFISRGATEIQLQKLITALTNNRTITNLCLNNTAISDNIVSQLIKNNQTIQTLVLGSNKLTSSALEHIADNKTLCKLYLCNNYLSDEVINLLLQNNTLTTINLASNDFKMDVNNLLKDHPSLKHVVASSQKNEVYVPIKFPNEDWTNDYGHMLLQLHLKHKEELDMLNKLPLNPEEDLNLMSDLSEDDMDLIGYASE